MRSTAARAALGAALLIAAIALFVLLGGGDDDGNGGAGYGGGAGPGDGQRSEPDGEAGTDPKPARPPVPSVVVRDGRAAGGAERLEFSAGERIRFDVESDVADEVHVHGYDVTEEVPAGRSARLDFPADIEGVFEVELHGSGEQIAELRVSP